MSLLAERCYAQHIDENLAALCAPFRRDDPSEAWQRFKQFYMQLHNRSHSRYVQSLQMGEISPVLVQLRDTVICRVCTCRRRSIVERILPRVTTAVARICSRAWTTTGRADHAASGRGQYDDGQKL